MDSLFDSVIDLFATNDNSLPEVCISGLRGDEVSEIYLFMRRITRFLVGAPVFRHLAEHADKYLDSVNNAAQLVVSGEANPFHFLTRGIKISDIILPDLGVFVFDNAIALDYEKGKAWGKPQIKAFFELLGTVFSKAVGPRLKFNADTGKDENARFTHALAAFGASGKIT